MSRNDQKTLTRQRILDAAGRSFRRGGFGGVGVDGLAKQAGVTSGAFYVHFASKEAAFQEAVVAGIEELRQAVESLQREHGDHWVEALVDFYLGYKRTCDLSDSCAMQSLIPEVGRADAHMKSAVEPHMRAVAKAIAEGLPGPADSRTDRAWALLAVLTGGVSLARAVKDPPASDLIASAIRRIALDVAYARTEGTAHAVGPTGRPKKHTRNG